MNRTKVNRTNVNQTVVNFTRVNATGVAGHGSNGSFEEDTYILEDAILLKDGGALLKKDGTPIVYRTSLSKHLSITPQRVWLDDVTRSAQVNVESDTDWKIE